MRRCYWSLGGPRPNHSAAAAAFSLFSLCGRFISPSSTYKVAAVFVLKSATPKRCAFVEPPLVENQQDKTKGGGGGGGGGVGGGGEGYDWT